jgi:hypothetical protein
VLFDVRREVVCKKCFSSLATRKPSTTDRLAMDAPDVGAPQPFTPGVYPNPSRAFEWVCVT